MIEIYNGTDTLTMMDGKTYDPKALASSQYGLMTKYKTVIWRANDDKAVFRWRFFDSVIGLLSDEEMDQFVEGTLSEREALAIIDERFDYVPPTNVNLADAVIEVSTQTDENTESINDIMDAIIEMTNV